MKATVRAGRETGWPCAFTGKIEAQKDAGAERYLPGVDGKMGRWPDLIKAPISHGEKF